MLKAERVIIKGKCGGWRRVGGVQDEVKRDE